MARKISSNKKYWKLGEERKVTSFWLSFRKKARNNARVLHFLSFILFALCLSESMPLDYRALVFSIMLSNPLEKMNVFILTCWISYSTQDSKLQWTIEHFKLILYGCEQEDLAWKWDVHRIWQTSILWNLELLALLTNHFILTFVFLFVIYLFEHSTPGKVKCLSTKPDLNTSSSSQQVNWISPPLNCTQLYTWHNIITPLFYNINTV